MGSVLDLRAISKRFGGVAALDRVDLSVEVGEIHCLAGENGSGKSTLIKIISGVQPPEPGGAIAILGETVHGLTPADSIRRGIQVIYQDLSLFTNLTVAENVAVGLNRGLHLVRRRAMREVAAKAIARIGVSLDLDAYVADLPIAQRQLVAICRALAAAARLVIMDAPTAALTRREVDALLALALELKRRGIAVMFVSHRLDEVLEIAERVTVLRNGEKVGTYAASGMTGDRLGELMTGKTFSYRTRDAARTFGPPVLSVARLSRTGDYRDIDLEVRAGEVVGITGRLGSGRTELALSLFGMNPPDAGEIRVRGEALVRHDTSEAIRRGVAYVSEDRLSLGLVMQQSIADNITLSVLDRLRARFGLIPAGRRAATVGRGIGELGIKTADPRLAVRTLSGGNQQRVVLAKWLATQPSLLILDSPTVGVDIGAKDGIYAIVHGLAAQGLAVLMISDEIPEVFYHSDRVLVMREGVVAGEIVPSASSEDALRQLVDA